ncbi:MAG: hypothetical protein ACFFG0_13985, partial [Candidatus Thorarchaeota archaeon]
YICNVYGKEIGEKLLFLYKVLIDPSAIFAIAILIIIVFFMVFRENFYEYGIRNSIWLTPIIIGQSWIWNWIIYDFDITIIGEFFTRYEGYVTISSILGINFFTAVLAAILKEYFKEKLKKV